MKVYYWPIFESSSKPKGSQFRSAFSQLEMWGPPRYLPEFEVAFGRGVGMRLKYDILLEWSKLDETPLHVLSA